MISRNNNILLLCILRITTDFVYCFAGVFPHEDIMTNGHRVLLHLCVRYILYMLRLPVAWLSVLCGFDSWVLSLGIYTGHDMSARTRLYAKERHMKPFLFFFLC